MAITHVVKALAQILYTIIEVGMQREHHDDFDANQREEIDIYSKLIRFEMHEIENRKYLSSFVYLTSFCTNCTVHSTCMKFERLNVRRTYSRQSPPPESSCTVCTFHTGN